MGYEVKVGISNKHVHLSQADVETLFGKGHELTYFKDLGSGQFSCEEKVDLVGPKKTIKGLRVLGPARKETQVELALTDGRQAGFALPIRESGKLEGTPGCKLIGPCGEVELDHGVIAALRHLHISEGEAKEAGLVDKQIISLKVKGERELVFGNLLVRVGGEPPASVHLDTDEGNAACLSQNSICEVIK